MADLKTQAKTRASMKSSSKSTTSSSLGAKAKARGPAKKTEEILVFGQMESQMAENKRRESPTYVPPVPGNSAPLQGPADEKMEAPVPAHEPYLDYFAKIPGLRKRGRV
jgi:hypothetical protein